MKVSFKKVVIWVVVVVVAAVVLIQPGSQRGKYIYQVETINGICNFDYLPQDQQQDVRVVRNSIVVTMPIQTPTPCYDVEGTVNSVGSDIVVNLQTKQRGETCAECLGIVVARVTISNLEKDTYSVQINTPDKSIITTAKVE